MNDELRDLDPELCNYSLLRKASRRVSLAYDRALSASGLTIAQFGILAEVAGWPDPDGPTMAALAETLVMDRAALSQSLKPLIAAKLVRVKRDPDDGRSRRAGLTALGSKRLQKAGLLWKQAQAAFAERLGEGEITILHAALKMVVSRVSLPLVPQQR